LHGLRWCALRRPQPPVGAGSRGGLLIPRVVEILLSVGMTILKVLLGSRSIHTTPLPITVLAPVSIRVLAVSVAIVPGIHAIVIAVDHRSVRTAVNGSVLAGRGAVTCCRSVRRRYVPSLGPLPVARRNRAPPLCIGVMALKSGVTAGPRIVGAGYAIGSSLF
jgi:hypothetical protein